MIVISRISRLFLACTFLFGVQSCHKAEDTPEVVHTAVDSFLQKDGLRILDIGNSYTEDATALLPLLVDAANIDLSGMSLYKVIRGGASYKSWCDIYSDRDNNNSYRISKVIGDYVPNVPQGDCVGTDGQLFRTLITDVSWDLIFIHQISNYAPYYDEWKTDGPGGYLNQLLNILKKHQPDAKIGFLLVHSYSSDYPLNIERSSHERWRLISESVRKLCEDYSIDYVIPYGTAIQNIRASSLNDQYDLTKDGSHCGDGLCRYTAACCYFESIIAPRVGISVLNNPAQYIATCSSGSSISVTQSNSIIAQRAAVLAKDNWYRCLDPERF